LKKDIFDILVEISEIMNSVFDTEELIPQILDITEKFLNVKKVSLMLIEGNYLKIVAATNFPGDYKKIKILIGDGISGEVAQTGKPVVVNNDENYRDELGYKTKSYLCFPLKVKDKIIGVLNLTDKEDDYFDNKDVKIAAFVASQCALAINRFALFDERKKAEHLELIGKFTSYIAHDIKNLLQIVQGYIELMDIELKENSELRFYLEAIWTEIKLIHGMTLDILDFSKNRIMLKKQKVKLSNLLKEIEKHVNILIKLTPIEFHIKYEKDVDFFCDQEKLFRALFNLINNSLEAVDEHGKISLTVKVDDNFLVFELSDNGKGIKAENIEKIFDPFFTAGKTKGAGLGLAVVKEIIREHNGDITVCSKENEFTKFTVRLPLA
jgi:signal transduction histidine kinase